MPTKGAFETLAIHAGQKADPSTGAVMTPIYQTSTFKQDSVGEHKGYEYARTGNPTRRVLEDCLAALEAGQHGLAFASGMAASDAVVHLLQQGDHILAGHDLYGGTFRLFERVFRPLGLDITYADARNSDEFLGELRPETKLVWLETPTNPLLDLCDIGSIAAGAHESAGPPWVCVDNTFATPYLQQPLTLGADIVLHSTTKYLGGHSDVVGGALVVDDDELAERLAYLQNAIGAVPGPMDCFLVLRGIKTLAVRMERHCENAAKLADWLTEQPGVAQVYYPGLTTHDQFQLAQRQMRAPGGMISFRVTGGEANARAVAAATQVFTLAESLGGVESLIAVPAAMTHASTAGSQLEVPPDLVRLSVGIEHIDDLVADLEAALEQARD